MLELTKKHICSLISTFSISSKTSREKLTAKFDNYDVEVKNTFEILAVLQNFDNQLKNDVNKGIFIIKTCNQSAVF